MVRRALTVVAAVLMVGFGGCGSDQSREDSGDLKHACKSPEDTSLCIDKTPKRVIGFHNHYSNVSESCDGFGHRIYVTTAKKVMVITDPTCPGYVKQPPQAVSAP